MSLSAQGSILVTIDNFVRTESDFYLSNALKDARGLGRFAHHCELMPVERRVVVRPNRKYVLFPDGDRSRRRIGDHHAADAGKRYSAMQVINEDQWVVAMSNTARESTP